jgi:type VI secretion system secreted protein VgrG
MGYQEGNRYLYLDTPLGDSQLLLQNFSGSEGINELFDFHLELLAENATNVDFDKLIGQKVSFGVLGADSRSIARDFNGIVVELSQGLRDQEFTVYHMRVVPDLWKLTKKFQSRIFQHITVPDILKQVLAGLDVSLTDIQGTFEQREYCTQYRETDFDFLSRMLEEEGIYYYFKFARGSHKLVLANTPPSHPDIPGDSKVIYETTAGGLRDEERITWWEKAQVWGSGKYTTWDHHFQLPHRHLEAQASSGISVQVGKISHKLNLAGNDSLEIYDYPAAYAQRFDGVDKSGSPKPADLQKISPDATRTDDIRIEQQETPTLLIHGTSNCRQLTAGHKFTLQRHFNADGKYVVLKVSHSAAEADFRSNQSEPGESRYMNSFGCLPFELPYRPPRLTEKPVIAGPQTAVVVGPGGEEIFTDKFGRVKVQFHWDRAGKYDGDSSCWLRVGTLWAGKQWGSIFIPRIGHEVIVVFLEGDPDRPIIVGSVYNADTMPPYDLPANKTRSGIKTDSSIGSGGFNEIRFEDKKGSEQIFIHGQMDSDTRIENDAREWIGRDRHLIVKRDKYEEIDRDIHIDIKGDHKEKIEGDRNLATQGKEAVQVSGTQSVQVTGDVAEQFSGNHGEQVTGSFYLQANNIVIEANEAITLTNSISFIGINSAGVNIVGTPVVLINSGGAAVPGIPGFPVSPAPPSGAMEADSAVAGSEVSYSGGGDAPAPPPPPAPGPPAPPASRVTPTPTPTPTPPPTCRITSQTIVQLPADRARTKVGVGEEVSCTFSLGNANWSLAGAGSFSNSAAVTTASGTTVSYFAPDVAGTATLTATGSGCTATITFTTIPPSTVHMDPISDVVEHTKGFPDVGMHTSIYIGPDDVNFYNIHYHEVDVPMQADGVYSCWIGTGHDAHPATVSPSATVVQGKGTYVNASDHVYSSYCGAPPANPTGHELYPIPYEYWVGTGTKHRFASPVNQSVTCQATGALNASKAGANANTTISANSVPVAD